MSRVAPRSLSAALALVVAVVSGAGIAGAQPDDDGGLDAEPAAAPPPDEAPAPAAAGGTSVEPVQATASTARVTAAADAPSSEAAARALVSADRDIPVAFTVWESGAGDGFIKPVLQLATTVVGYAPSSEANPDLANRVSTLVLARFGLEGQLNRTISFRSVFERNLGFNIGRNGPVGTSVWEGTASLQARESYIRLMRHGFELSGGIVRDPAAADYISENVLDVFGVDPYVRDPLLFTGFNQGQAVLLRYRMGLVTPGLAYTAGNPLVSSLAYAFGGDVSTLGTLFTAPLRAFSSGIPGSDIHMHVVSPSVTVEQGLVDFKAAAQFYYVDVDVTQAADQRLTGYNLRGTVQMRPAGERVRLFASGSYRRNEQLAIPDLTTLKSAFEALAFGGGADLRLGAFSVGGMYYWIDRRLGGGNDVNDQILNVGATYWLAAPNASIGARYAMSRGSAANENVRTLDTHVVFLGLRLIL